MVAAAGTVDESVPAGCWDGSDMPAPSERERTNWRLLFIGFCLGALVAVTPLAVVGLVLAAGTWVGEF